MLKILFAIVAVLLAGASLNAQGSHDANQVHTNPSWYHGDHSYPRHYHDPLHHDSHLAPSKATKLPMSWRIPDSNTQMRIGGYVKLDAIYDFNEIGNQFQFLTPTIPTTSDNGGRSTFHARQSRIFFETQTPTCIGNLKTYIEADFFGIGNALRLRHAYAETPRLLVGQTWSTFMNIAAHPRTLDFEGPPGKVFRRHAQIRYKIPITDQLLMAVAIENPNSAVDFTGTDLNRTPDFAAHSIYKWQQGHLQVAGLLRDVGFQPDAGPTAGMNQTETGYGFSISGSLKLMGKDNVRFQYAQGTGIGDYIADLNGGGVLADGTTNLAGELELLDVTAWFVAYEHWWNPAVRSSFVYGRAELENLAGQSPNAFTESEYVAANLVWSPIKSVDIGLEYQYGSHVDFANDRGEANRLQLSTVWRF